MSMKIPFTYLETTSTGKKCREVVGLRVRYDRHSKGFLLKGDI
jgi:hypothetical protein